MTKKQRETILKCIELLSVAGINSKKIVKEMLEAMMDDGK